jgi:hypothetical protein
MLNGVNGRYLRDLVEQAAGKTERVDAAVAYVSDDDLLFEWCWKNEIPLRFWGRFDDGVPVKVTILERFLKRRSARFVCRLVRRFHPKIIWWRGFGAYIGSANLTQSAWWTNVEAGVFLTEEELAASGQADELESLFSTLDLESSPLTNELVDLLRLRSAQLERQAFLDREASKAQIDSHLVKPWSGLATVDAKSAADRRKTAFLEEWKSTLQIIRDISGIISLPEHRPSWVSELAPLGAQADQFLHAHYYQRTFVGKRADYETHFERNRDNPDAAVKAAAAWWRSLKFAPMSEDVMLNETAPMLHQALSRDGLLGMTQSDFIDVLSKVHASIEYSRRVGNNDVGLAGGRAYTIPEKLQAMGEYIWQSSATRGAPVARMLEYVLHDGSLADTPERMWDALHGSRWSIPFMGVSTLGEIVGWAHPDTFPPRNGRTSKALRSLGHHVRVHVGG